VKFVRAHADGIETDRRTHTPPTPLSTPELG
jgi:hypothetical protein